MFSFRVFHISLSPFFSFSVVYNFFIYAHPFSELISDVMATIQEETFQNRPSIKLVMPDHLKAMLVDDWENITKNQQLVPIPHPHPFDKIVKDYVEWELPHRPDDSAEKDLLEETMSGLREYFNKALGRILLYK